MILLVCMRHWKLVVVNLAVAQWGQAVLLVAHFLLRADVRVEGGGSDVPSVPYRRSRYWAGKSRFDRVRAAARLPPDGFK